MFHDPRGSMWYRWDMHFHTPSSFDYHDKSVTNKQIVDRLLAEGVRVVCVTDHHTIDVARIRELQKLGAERLTVLPAMELRDDHGGKPINYICIFSEDSNLEHVWTTLQGKLGLTPAAVKAKGGDDKIYVPIELGANTTRELGGIVSIHAGAKSNSIEEISNKEQFQQRIKYDITKQWVDILEIGQLKDIDIHHHKIFPTTGLDRPLVICSDNHDIKTYSTKGPLWLRCDPTFRGLLMVLKESQDRVFIGTRPPLLTRLDQSPTKFVRGISFGRAQTAKTKEKWFGDSITFNPGLVAIVGNKGGGKSALADTLGLLGGTKNGASFSFLNKGRFRHPKANLASQFAATLTWESGESRTKLLSDDSPQEEAERIKYLPQDHVENVCNQVGEVGEQQFERELKGVILSHVPEEQRLGFQTLDELLWFQSGEKQKQIDALVAQLRDVSRARSYLEAQTDPVTKAELYERLKQRKNDLIAHDAAVPKAVPNPNQAENGTDVGKPALLAELETLNKTRAELSAKIATADARLTADNRRHAVAMRLLEKLANLAKQFEVLRKSLAEDAAELGISTDSLAQLTMSSEPVKTVANECAKRIEEVRQLLDAAEPPGLRKQAADCNLKLLEIKAKLDEPNRQYQAYLKELEEWKGKRAEIEGNDSQPDSLNGLKAAESALQHLPSRIAEQRKLQLELAANIIDEKRGQIAIYRTLYGPVQQFIDSHPIAKDKLKLEFRAELVSEDFPTRLIEFLALNRRGSFMGSEDARRRAEQLVEAVNWEDGASVQNFLDDVDRALHFDQRETTPTEVLLKSQVKGRKVEDLFDFVYGLDYVRSKYVLRWDGKDLAMLSPGERGTLLLAFYLLIDKSDAPLVIDQPEGNLDNQTVAKVLVDCIREARNRRQVFIVTHNPNLAVVCDADQVIHASIDKGSGNAITYRSGALENPALNDVVMDVLEGTRWAFRVRDGKYGVGEHEMQ